MPKTMHEEYGEPDDEAGKHECCSECGFCRTCGDCEKYGCSPKSPNEKNIKKFTQSKGGDKGKGL